MIARTWRGWATHANADAYHRHFASSVVPELKELPGHCGAWLLRRDGGDRTEFLALTLWASREAIAAFAGPDIGKAHVEPAARAILSEFDDFATHFEVALRAP